MKIWRNNMSDILDKLEIDLEDMLFELQTELIYPGNIDRLKNNIIILENKLPRIQILINNIKVELRKHND